MSTQEEPQSARRHSALSGNAALDQFAKRDEGSAGAPWTDLRTPGQDEWSENEVGFVYEDAESDDFDALSKQVVDYDQTWVKTSAGRFQGRQTSAYLADSISVHLETVNCGVYQRVGRPANTIGLGVSLGPPGTVANGIELDRTDLLIGRPGAELELDVSAGGGTFLVLSAKRGLLESLPCTDAGWEHLDPEGGGVSVFRSACVAGALEAGGTGLLRACGRAPDARLPQGTATALVAAIVAALDFQASLGAARERKQRKQGFATFADARDAMVGMEDFDYAALASATGRGPRSIQMAFAQYARTTPLRYFRALKLHRVRDVLLADAGDRTATIGDIAAAHGFWSWSRFTRLYRLQFGETPSETRSRAKRP